MTEKIVAIRYPEGQITLDLPVALDKLSIGTLKKIFRILLEKDWFVGNGDTIREIDEFIPVRIADWKEQWDYASKVFQINYRDPSYGGKSPKERKQIRRENDQLVKDVKHAKKHYEKAEKVLSMWTELKEKYYVR